MEETEIHFWRQNWDRSVEIMNHTSPIEKLRVARRSGLIIEAVSGPNTHHEKKVLELGCGTGVYTIEFAKEKWELTATDLVPEMAEATRAKLAEYKKGNKHKNIKVMEADALSLPFAKASFEAVVGNSILHHLVPVEMGLKEIYRVLKPGGKVAFTEPNMINPHIFLQKNIGFLKKLAGDSPGETAFVRWKLAGRLRDQGFVNVRVEPFDFLYPFLPISLIGLVRSMGLTLEKVPLLRELAGSVVISAEKP